MQKVTIQNLEFWTQRETAPPLRNFIVTSQILWNSAVVIMRYNSHGYNSTAKYFSFTRRLYTRKQFKGWYTGPETRAEREICESSVYSTELPP